MTITRRNLRQKLQDKGFTYRESRLLVTAILEALVRELKTSGRLELPFIDLEFSKPKPQRHYRFGKIVKTHTKPKVHFRKKD